MTSTLDAASPTTASPAGGTVVWTFDPWSEHPVTAALAAAGAAGMCVLILAARLPFLLGVALALFCVAALAPALSPVECRADAGGARRRGPLGWQQRSWRDVRRAEGVPAGLLLSAHERRHWLDATRAMVLPMPAARRAELRAAVDALRGAHGH